MKTYKQIADKLNQHCKTYLFQKNSIDKPTFIKYEIECWPNFVSELFGENKGDFGFKMTQNDKQILKKAIELSCKNK